MREKCEYLITANQQIKDQRKKTNIARGDYWKERLKGRSQELIDNYQILQQEKDKLSQLEFEKSGYKAFKSRMEKL